MLILGLIFLYLPMLVLIVYSFNESRLVTLWSGFSTKWYFELFKDDQLISAVGNSLEIAFFSASMAIILGTMSALVVSRFGNFRGRTLFNSMIAAPSGNAGRHYRYFPATVVCFHGTDLWLAC